MAHSNTQFLQQAALFQVAANWRVSYTVMNVRMIIANRKRDEIGRLM